VRNFKYVSLFFTKEDQGDPSKEDEMGGACNIDERDKKNIHIFDQRTRLKNKTIVRPQCR
jgi:hypothetical protein